jgi:hypothetical protein
MKKYIIISITLILFSISCGSNDIYSKLTNKIKKAVNLTISPVNSITSTTLTIQYNAALVFDDGTTEDITALATWSVAGDATAGSSPGSIITGSTSGTATVSVSYGTLTSANATLTILSGIFVSDTTGNDSTGDGTTVNPYATIGHAIIQAGSTPTIINIAAGDYYLTTPLNLSSDGVSLYGGYDVYWNYDLAIPANIARIHDQGALGAAITCTSAITPTTIISGLDIYGSTAGTVSSATAISTTGRPTISNCTITGGWGNGTGASYGIFSTAASGTTTITNSTVSGGNGPFYSYGIYATSNFQINNSNINGGSTTGASGSSNGIYLTAAATVVTNTGTSISGGYSTGTNSSTYGVYTLSSSSNYLHSTNIYGGATTNTGGKCYGIYSNGTGKIYLDSGTYIYAGSGIINSYGIYINTASAAGILFLSNAVINGGYSTSSSSGIFSADTGASIIEFSNIDGGSAPYTTAIMQPTIASSTLVIRNSIISGGDGTLSSTGITLQNNANPSPYLYNNVIICGTNAAGASTVTGISLGQGASPIIANNTISTGNSNSNAYGIYTAYGAKPYIYNNIFLTPSSYGSRYGIYEAYPSADPTEMMNNIFWGITTIYHNYVDGTADNNWSTIATMESGLTAEGSTIASGNFNVDPQIVGSGDYHLSSVSSPAIGAGLNGLDEGWTNFPLNTSSFPIDFDGTQRPLTTFNWSIGAFEY